MSAETTHVNPTPPMRSRTVNLCSQCLRDCGPDPFVVTQRREDYDLVICSLRCMALWALARGWRPA